MCEKNAGRAAFIQKHGKFENVFVLVDGEKNIEIWKWSDGECDGLLISGQEDIEISMDQEGFYIEGAEGVEFRSLEFTQTLLEKEKTENWESGKVRFDDIKSGKSFECFSAIPGEQIPWENGSLENAKGQIRFYFPTHLKTEWRKRSFDEYDHIVESLQAICEASVETGNPIRWA